VFPVSDVIPSRSTPVVTLGLIAANGLLFLYELMLPDAALRSLFHAYGVVPGDFVWLSVVTSAFLHAGWLHFLGNMLYLWIFGDNVEDRLGHSGFLAFYLACGAVAALAQAEINPHSFLPMVGASGAIAGVMGAYIVLYPQSRVLTAVFLFFYLDLIEIPALIFLGVWFLMQFFTGLGSIGADAASGGVAFGAHIVGFAIGATIGAIWRGRERRRRELWQ
jgi:rhomboid family protein